MKSIATYLFITLSYFSVFEGKAQSLRFTYDPAGNQSTRELICRECIGTVDPSENRITQTDLLPTQPKKKVRYYPNPVTDELHLEWTTENEVYLSSIVIYSLNGAYLKTYSNLEKQTAIQIPFYLYPEGVYSLLLHYTNGEQLPVKILKKGS